MEIFGSKKPKRIKNAQPKVIFDKNGNLVKNPLPNQEEKKKIYRKKLKEVKSQKKKDDLKKKREQKEKARAESFNTMAEPYDFPGDIVKSIKNSAKKISDSVFPSSSENAMNRLSKTTAVQKTVFIVAAVAFVSIFTTVSFNVWLSSFKDTDSAPELTDDENARIQKILDRMYPKKRGEKLKSLPYKVSPAKLDVWSGSAILADAESGCVLYEKNADDVIPPASITKLFVMYIVFKEIESGKIHLSDVVPLPERTWAENLPSDASRMNLGKGQTVTLDELLAGLAVASGNDAALAVAYYISGSVDEFVERMNNECRKLGLKNTHFVEPSGYDENNETTARELCEFARIYINRFPQSIERYHSMKSISYPLEKNLPSWQKSAGDSKAIKQTNTNPLLGKLRGVDGIKTGFIYESGYNLALTANRDGQRFISITMKGPGKGTRQGNEGRVHDGTEIMEWAFNAFHNFRPNGDSVAVPALASDGGKFLRLVPAWTSAIPVPNISGTSAKENADSVQAAVNVPPFVFGEIEEGKQYGEIQYKLGGITLETVPLVAAKSAKKSGLWGRFWGTLAKSRLKK